MPLQGMILRSEEMDKDYWWWAVFDSSNEMINDSDSHHPEKYKTGKDARKAAELAALKAYDSNGN